MKRSLIILFTFLSISVFGQLKTEINSEIREKNWNKTRYAAVFDHMVDSLHLYLKTLANGNGTTANGNSIGLGGTATSAISIDLGSNNYSISGVYSGRTQSMFLSSGGVSINSTGGAAANINLYCANGGTNSQIDLQPGQITVNTPIIELAGSSTSIPTNNSVTTKSYVLGAKTYTGKQTFVASLTTAASLNIPSGTTPTGGITDGDIWQNANHLYSRLNGVTYQLDQQSGSGTVSNVASADGSITVTNPTSTVDLAVLKAPILTTSRTIGTLTGDATSAGSSFDGSANNTNALTLATVNSNVGSFGSATQSPTITVNGKGLVTAVSNTTITPAVGSITGLGTGVGTWLATPSYTNLTSALTGTSPYWMAASGATLTGPNLVTGSTTNTFTMDFPNASTTLTDGVGIHLRNPTAAAAGLQQASPGITLEGRGWKTNSTAGSQPIKFVLYGSPTQGTVNPTASFRVAASINGSGYLNVFGVSNTGILSIPEQIVSTGGGATFAGSGTGGTGSARVAVTSTMVLTGSSHFLSTGENAVASTNTASVFSYTGTMNASSTGTQTIYNASFPVSQAVSVIGFDYNPTTPGNISGTNLARRSTSGSDLIGGTTITASTRVDQRGLGTTSSTINHRWANSSNTLLASLTDDGTMSINHIAGNTSAPSIAAGAGAGTSPTISITGTDLGGYISVTTGTLPTLSAIVATITFNIAYISSPRCITLTPANSNTSTLSGLGMVFVDQAGISTTTFAITAGATALTASTAYKWYYQIVQ